MAWVLVPNFYFRWLHRSQKFKKSILQMISPKVSEMRWVRYPQHHPAPSVTLPCKAYTAAEVELSCAAAPMTSQRDDLMQNSPNPSFQIYSFFHKLKVKSLLTSPASNHCNYKQFHLSTKGCTLFTEIKNPSNGAIFF